MATITGKTQEKVFSLKQWGGLNENPDGDTKLKLGEASVMTNWKVTRDGNLKRRPGSEFVSGIATVYVKSVASVPMSIPADGEIRLFEQLYVTATGHIELRGESASATPANASEYIGWYFQRGGKYWKLSGFEEIAGGHIWSALRVTAVSALGSATPVTGLWSGYLNNKEVLLAAGENHIYQISFDTAGAMTRTQIGVMQTSGGVHMFGFGGLVYFMNGVEYKQWDGTTFQTVHGYRPLVAIALTPDGANETLESVNLLNGERRVWISPDGNTDDEDDPNVNGRTFQLPEKEVSSIDYVQDLKTGENLSPTEYVYNLTAGTVTFSAAPMQSVNSYEIGYTMATTYRNQVEKMRYSELYSGTQDTRIFIYGDGSNMALYSGLDYDGTPRGDYFPDLNAVHVGDSNTPITSMIRHYSTLICYKYSSAWSISYGVMALTDDSLAPAFYATPINRTVGHEALGQVRLVDNQPITLSGGEVYQWRNSSYYSSNLTQDERQAHRISDRIQRSVKEFDQFNCFCWDDNYSQEYYICCDSEALVWNYAADAWYKYEHFDVVCMTNFANELFYGTSDGKIMRLTYDVPDNDSEPIEAHWESGAIDFGQDYMRKYSAMLWVGIKPDDDTAVTVTVRTDRKEEYSEKMVVSSKARVEGEPFLSRCKIKAKKFTFYTLIFKSDGTGDPPTINSADIRVRFTGYQK